MKVSLKNHLFVCGCPHSDTSSFTRYLNTVSGKFSVFMERYGNYFKKFYRFPEHAFSRERLLEVEKKDTFYTDISR